MVYTDVVMDNLLLFSVISILFTVSVVAIFIRGKFVHAWWWEHKKN
jgi:hypothetical protein